MKKIYLIAAFVLMASNYLFAQWDGNTATVNNPVSTASTSDQSFHSVTDGAGGIIVVWAVSDFVSSTSKIYAQRKTSAGGISWLGAGTPVELFSVTTTGSYNVEVKDVKPDGAGGAYICWGHTINDTAADLYLQRINSSGSEVFTSGGIKINPANGHYYSDGRICADAAGIILCWSDQVLNVNAYAPIYAQVFAQRYSTAGVPQWGTAGSQVSIANGLRAVCEITSDGSNGAFIAFADTRNSVIDTTGVANNLDIYAQHISSTGARLWGAADAVVSNEGYNQYTLNNDYGNQAFSSMLPDNAGGFIIVYEDYRNNNDSAAKLYAQRLNSSGTRLWAAGGLKLYGSSSLYYSLTQVLNDGANGMIASWDANNYSTQTGTMYAQHISGAGTLSWGPNGIAVSPANLYEYRLAGTLADDGTGSYVACWSYYDSINGPIIRAQKLNGSGIAQWTAAGVDICTNPLSQPYYPFLTKSTGGNMIVAWEDYRNRFSTQADIYSAKISTNGSLINSTIVSYISAANGNWNMPATWIGNAVPPAGADVIVRHTVTGNINTSCSSLRVESPGHLTVNTGINITVLQ